jgi:hypothetical protein
MNISNSHIVRLKTEDDNQTMNAIRAFPDFEAQFICYAVSGHRARKKLRRQRFARQKFSN